ncbi:MAG: PAS domain S-box protein, partial [Bacteroidota bacterium]
MEISHVSTLAHLAFTQITDEVCCVDFTGKIHLANAAMEQRLLPAAAPMRGLNILSFQFDLTPSQWQKIWLRLNSEHEVKWLGLHLPKTGSPYPVEVLLKLIGDPEDQMALYQAKPHQSEVLLGDWKLASDEEPSLSMTPNGLFQQVFDHSPLGIILSSPAGEILLANSSICQKLGWREIELYEKDVFSLTHKFDRKVHRTQFLSQIKGEEDHSEGKRRYLKADGSFFWSKTTERIVRNHQKEIEYTITMIEDISAEVDAREKREAQYQTQRFIFDALPVIFYHKDDKNNIINCNAMAAQSMGMTVKELIGCNAIHIHPSLAAQYHQDDLAVINTGEPVLGIIEK